MLKLNDRSLLIDRCLIGGRWVGVPGQAVVNPATGETIAVVPHMGAVEAESAVEHAALAFPAWSTKTAKERSRLLKRWNDLIQENAEDLACLLSSEQGKPLAEARAEIAYAASYVEFFAEEAKRVYGETLPTHRADARLLVLRQPIGVVAAITPWNFPAAMVTRKVAPALAAGCSIVLKPSPETPLTAFALAALAERAGIPDGVLNVVTGDAPAIGQVMTTHPAVRCVTFTGSTGVGKSLMAQSASTVKRLGLELGGNAPFIVFDDADLDAAVSGAIDSKFRNMGQTCVCANRLYVQSGIYDAFVEKLGERVAQLKVGNGFEDGVQQGPLISRRAVEKVEGHVQDAVGRGARIVAGGARHALGGNFFQPTVLADVTAEMDVTREETFGPLAPVYRFADEAEVVRQANDTPFGLAAYFFTRDLGRVFRVAEALEVGMVSVNSGLMSTETAPFGGVKESGQGREGSRHGIGDYLELKYVQIAGIL